jgi:hypothetical protein
MATPILAAHFLAARLSKEALGDGEIWVHNKVVPITKARINCDPLKGLRGLIEQGGIRHGFLVVLTETCFQLLLPKISKK